MVSGNGIELTNWDMRRALEEAAYVLTTADYEANAGAVLETAVPVNDAAPYLQIGWGAITPDPERGVIEQTLAHLGIDGEVTRTKDAATCGFMTLNIEARWAYWDVASPMSDSWMTSDFPYEYC
jgi:hypothetical protein